MDLVNAVGSPYTAQHVINLGYVLINKCGKFGTGIREWNRIPQDQRTWDAFQTHFSQAHCKLRESGKLEIRETPFDTANFVQEIVEGVQQVLQPAFQASYEAEADDLQHQANLASSAPTQQTDLLHRMMQMMQLIQHQLQQNSSQPRRNNFLPSPHNNNNNHIIIMVVPVQRSINIVGATAPVHIQALNARIPSMGTNLPPHLLI